MSKTKNTCYAYLRTDTSQKGITKTWKECETKTKGKPARYKGFKTKEEAQNWLEKGAKYTNKPKSQTNKKNTTFVKLQDAIYFDAGTGRGDGVEVRVTNKEREPLLYDIIDTNNQDQINKYGNINLGKDVTNNYGELIGSIYALQFALKTNQKLIFGDSQLIIKYWSKGHYKKELPANTREKIKIATLLRTQFENLGGEIKHISGDINPADLGFHK